jgi:hypothetical protein
MKQTGRANGWVAPAEAAASGCPSGQRGVGEDVGSAGGFRVVPGLRVQGFAPLRGLRLWWRAVWRSQRIGLRLAPTGAVFKLAEGVETP